MNKFLSLVMLMCITLLSAQEFSMDLVKNMAPRNIGPGGMSGRVTAIDVVTNNPDIMYVGTASGGLWKSTSSGIKWEPIFDNEPLKVSSQTQVLFGWELEKEILVTH